MGFETETPAVGITDILRSYPMRLGLYGIATFVIYQVLFRGVRGRGPTVMGAENGPIEMAQVALAIVSAVLLFIAARRIPLGRAGLALCGAMVGYAAARELDSWFESVFFDDAYKWLVGLPLSAVALWALFNARKQLVKETMWLLQQPAATLFIVAGIFLGGVCQTLDRPDLWLNSRTNLDVQASKAMIEEYCELFAYLLFAFAGLEAVILAKTRRIAESQNTQSEPTQSLTLGQQSGEPVEVKRAA